MDGMSLWIVWTWVKRNPHSCKHPLFAGKARIFCQKFVLGLALFERTCYNKSRRQGRCLWRQKYGPVAQLGERSVRIREVVGSNPSGPPNKNRNFDTMRIKVAVLSFCLKALISKGFRSLSVLAAARQSDTMLPTRSAKTLGSRRLSFILWVPFNLWAIVYF